jgi:hypothetical protein
VVDHEKVPPQAAGKAAAAGMINAVAKGATQVTQSQQFTLRQGQLGSIAVANRQARAAVRDNIDRKRGHSMSAMGGKRTLANRFGKCVFIDASEVSYKHFPQLPVGS